MNMSGVRAWYLKRKVYALFSHLLNVARGMANAHRLGSLNTHPGGAHRHQHMLSPFSHCSLFLLPSLSLSSLLAGEPVFKEFP